MEKGSREGLLENYDLEAEATVQHARTPPGTEGPLPRIAGITCPRAQYRSWSGLAEDMLNQCTLVTLYRGKY